MNITLQRAPRGIALVVVMIAIFVLAVLAGAFAYAMKVETKLAMNANRAAADLWLGRSGVEVARWILAQGCPYTSLNQKWAGGVGDDCETNNSALAGVSLDHFEVGDRTISIRITDLERKANINLADQNMLRQALTLIGLDASEIPTVTDSILDWRDPNADSRITRVNGAKSDYYQSLEPPYSAKNGPIDDLSELLLIKGIRDRPEIYSADYRPATFQKVDRFGRTIEAPTYPVHLVDLFTPMSAGRINVNTASPEVLQLIPGFDENVASTISQQREQAPFPTLNEVPVPPQLRPALNQYGTVRSLTWKVEVEVDNCSRRFYAVVRTNSPRDIPILTFYWEDQ